MQATVNSKPSGEIRPFINPSLPERKMCATLNPPQTTTEVTMKHPNDIFAKVTEAAKRQNGWTVVAIADTGEGGGIVLFRHFSLRGGNHATAAFTVKPASVEFFWGHYDLSEADGFTDFTERVQARKVAA